MVEANRDTDVENRLQGMRRGMRVRMGRMGALGDWRKSCASEGHGQGLGMERRGERNNRRSNKKSLNITTTTTETERGLERRSRRLHETMCE